MDESSLVLAHLRALIQQLKWAEAALEQAAVEPRIKDAAKNGFTILFEQRRQELTKMQASVSEGGASENAWKQLARNTRLCGELFGECLGFLGSALMRSDVRTTDGGKPVIVAKKDDICEIADALLYELNNDFPETVKWHGVTLLAEGNFFTETTGLIRLPFPDYGIWNLPISVHELGHFVGPIFRDGKGNLPFNSMLQQKAQENLFKEPPLSEEQLDQQLNHLRELFSDLFAVYTLGPAYACSCVLLRFNPGHEAACEDNETHPSHAKRAHFIFKALEEMDRSEGSMKYGGIKDRLKELWETNLKVAGREPCLDKEDAHPLDYLLVKLFPMLNSNLSTARYKGWERAVDLLDKFLSEENPETVLGRDDMIADVLNAAWMWRLSLEKETAHVVQQGHRWASDLCREIMRRRSGAR